MKKSKKVLGTGIVVLMLSLLTIGYDLNDQYQTKKEETVSTNELKRIQKKVNALYSDESRTTLASNITLKEINLVEDAVHKLQNQSLNLKQTGVLNSANMEIGYAKNMLELENLISSSINSNGQLLSNSNVNILKEQIETLMPFKSVFSMKQLEILETAMDKTEQATETW